MNETSTYPTSDTLTFTDVIARAMKIEPPLEVDPIETPAGVRCAITGARIMTGYRRDTVEKGESPFEWVSESAGTVLAGRLPNSKGKMVSAMWNKGSIMCFESGAFYWPMQSPESAEREGRAAWRDAIPLVWREHRGERCVIVVTADVKKATWPMAARHGATPLSQSTGVVVHIPGIRTEACVVDWQRLCEVLELVANIRRAGFTSVKDKHAWPLWPGQLAADTSGYARAGRSETQHLQRLIDPHIGTPELLIAAYAEGYSLKDR